MLDLNRNLYTFGHGKIKCPDCGAEFMYVGDFIIKIDCGIPKGTIQFVNAAGKVVGVMTNIATGGKDETSTIVGESV